MNRIARFFDAEYADYNEDLPALQAYAQRTGGPLLELGCGTGRLLIPFARADYAVTGVDSSAAMLQIAEEARDSPDLLKQAPVTTRRSRFDEATAARKPILRWKPGV